MEFELGRAIIAGLVGTAVMTILMYMGFMMGMRMDMPLMLGTMLLPKGAAARLMGMVMHLINGAIFFIIYAALFSILGIMESLVLWGAGFGLVHGIISGLLMPMVGMMHPRMARTAADSGSDTVPAPGLLVRNVGGMAPLAFLIMHIVYGTVAALTYSL